MRNIIGNASIVKALRRTVTGGAVNHACVITGERGMGKKTLADAYAKALQCEAPVKGDACGVCRSCRLFAEGRHPDVFYVKGTKAKSIGVDDVRDQILHPMASKPFQYRYKIFIMDEADTATVQAQNALLKIIEEPPPYGVFIFLAAGLHSILPTVLSRCVVYKLKPHTDEDVRKALTRLGLPDQGVTFAQGNIGKAIEIASSERFAAMASLAEEVTQTIRGLDILSAMALYRRFEEYKDSVGLLLDMLYINFSHIAVECVDSIVTAKKALERNGSFQLTIELMLIELTGRYGPGDMR